MQLQETFVALSWKHLAGEILGVRLGHQASERALEPDINKWDILRGDIGPEENLVEVQYAFNNHMYNSFTLFPYEDGVMRQNNLYSGKPPIFTVEPPPSGIRPISTFAYNA